MSTDYEKFVQEVYQALVKQDAVANIDVQHDVVLTGKSGATHQIDVFWTFELAGQRYQTCIECKHYSSTVKKSHVASFAAVLADIGNANGIFVTTEGYQSGAKLLAKENNIRLLVITPTIQSVEITGVLAIPKVDNLYLQFDEAAREVLRAAGVDTYDLRKDPVPRLFRNDVTLESMGLPQLLAGKLTEAGGHVLDLTGMSISTEIGWLPLRQATFDLTFNNIEEKFNVTAENPVIAILEDVLENARFYVDEDGAKRAAPPGAIDE